MAPSTTTLLPILGFLALLGTPDSHAGEADPGMALATDITAAAPGASRSAAVIQALNDKEALELVIARLENTQGAYGAELSEAYFQLGTTEGALEHHEAAAAAFGKALQALRTGFGLHDLRQLPILEQLLTTSETLQDWDEVDSIHHLMHFITTKSPEADAELRFQSLVKLGRWKLRAEVDGLLPERAESVEEAVELYANEIDKLEAGVPYTGRSIHLATLYLDLAGVELHQATKKYEMPISRFGLEGQRSTSTVSCISFQTRDGRIVQSCTNVEVPNPNYYMGPSNKKNLEIRQHLDEVKNDVMQAYYALQNEAGEAGKRAALMAEMQRLTKAYNEFTTMNSKSSMYRLD